MLGSGRCEMSGSNCMEIRIIIPLKNRLCSILLACATLTANSMQAQTAAETFAKNVKGIQEYEHSSIERAGDSGNRAYIPYLRSVLTSTPEYRSPAEKEAVIAVVKLGDREKQRELECDFLKVDPATTDHLARDVLPKVGAGSQSGRSI